MRLFPLAFLVLACAHVPPPHAQELIVTVQSRLDRDVCALHLWGDEDVTQRGQNMLRPEPLRVGQRRDFVVKPMGPMHLEAVACDGRVVARRDVEPKDVTLTLAAR